MRVYPQEFKSANAAAQVNDSPYRFIRVNTHSSLFWIELGKWGRIWRINLTP